MYSQSFEGSCRACLPRETALTRSPLPFTPSRRVYVAIASLSPPLLLCVPILSRKSQESSRSKLRVQPSYKLFTLVWSRTWPMLKLPESKGKLGKFEHCVSPCHGIIPSRFPTDDSAPRNALSEGYLLAPMTTSSAQGDVKSFSGGRRVQGEWRAIASPARKRTSINRGPERRTESGKDRGPFFNGLRCRCYLKSISGDSAGRKEQTNATMIVCGQSVKQSLSL